MAYKAASPRPLSPREVSPFPWGADLPELTLEELNPPRLVEGPAFPYTFYEGNFDFFMPQPWLALGVELDHLHRADWQIASRIQTLAGLAGQGQQRLMLGEMAVLQQDRAARKLHDDEVQRLLTEIVQLHELPNAVLTPPSLRYYPIPVACGVPVTNPYEYVPAEDALPDTPETCSSAAGQGWQGAPLPLPAAASWEEGGVSTIEGSPSSIGPADSASQVQGWNQDSFSYLQAPRAWRGFPVHLEGAAVETKVNPGENAPKEVRPVQVAAFAAPGQYDGQLPALTPALLSPATMHGLGWRPRPPPIEPSVPPPSESESMDTLPSSVLPPAKSLRSADVVDALVVAAEGGRKVKRCRFSWGKGKKGDEKH